MVQNLEKLLQELKPEVKADTAFKQKLHDRLDGIIEFKQGNKVVRKISYLKVLLPILGCFVFVIGIFSITDIQLFNQKSGPIDGVKIESEDKLSEQISETQEINTGSPEQNKQDALSAKQRILAKAAENQNSSQTSEDTSNPTLQDNEISEENTTTQDDGSEAASFSTQLRGTPPVNDTPEADINTQEQEILDESEALLQDLLGPLTEEDSMDDSENADQAQSGSGESLQAEDSEIAIEIFTQSCESADGEVQTNGSGSMVCMENEVNICSRVDYENGKCENLE